MKKRTFFLNVLAYISIAIGVLIGIGNEKLQMEEFYSSIKLSGALIAIGFVIIATNSFLRGLKNKSPELLYPLNKRGR